MTESSDRVSLLYDAYNKITNASDITPAINKEYEIIINAVKNSKSEKQLAARFLPQFFDKFNNLQDKALNAILDLCEDEDAQVRLVAIPGLGDVAKKSIAHRSKVADVLTQLLLVNDEKELNIVKKTFSNIFELDPKMAFDGLLVQVKDGDDVLKEKGVSYLHEQMNELKKVLNADEDLQKHLVIGMRQILESDGVSPKSFNSLLLAITHFSLFRTDPTLPDELLALVEKHAGLDKEFDPASEENIEQFASHFRFIGRVRKFNRNNFLKYFFVSIAPVFDQLPAKSKLVLMKTVAASFPSSAEFVKEVFPKVVVVFKKELPLETNENEKTNFSVLECLLFLLLQYANVSHNSMKEQLGIFVPSGQPSDFAEGLAEKRNDAIKRLNNLETAANTYHSKLLEVRKGIVAKLKECKEPEERKTLNEKKTVANSAIRCSGNIVKMVKQLTKDQPSFGVSNIWLSFKNKKPKSMINSAPALKKRGIKNERPTGKKNKFDSPNKRRRDGNNNNQVNNRKRRALSNTGNDRKRRATSANGRKNNFFNSRGRRGGRGRGGRGRGGRGRRGN